ncbi:MAG: hypothetical protein V7767_10605 [Leeuwenhoekiella sp.]
MKFLRLKIIVILFTFSASCEAQNINILSTTEFSQIRVSNYLLSSIKESNGSKQAIQNLLSNSYSYKEYNEPEMSKEYSDSLKNLKMLFEDRMEAGNNYELAFLEITGPQSTLTLKNKRIRVGDNISLLGAINTNRIDGRKVAFFQVPGRDESFSIYTDSKGVISKIEYNLFN